MDLTHEYPVLADDAPIPLEDYAFVSAARADGISLADVLAHRNIDGRQWRRGQTYWDARLEAEPLSALEQRLLTLQAEARESWRRPLPPLEDDLRSWLDFQRSLAAGPEALARLDELGIVIGDLSRLQAVWQQRLQADHALAERARAIASQPPQPVDMTPVARPCLAKTAASVPPTAALERATPAGAHPPGLSVAMPDPMDVTVEDDAKPRESALPFDRSDSTAPVGKVVDAASLPRALPFKPQH